jgi:GT2 family glycosyltransferase
MITLSIIIVSYNTENFLKQCLASLYGMNCRFSFEIIVVDNNSRDGSCKMVQKDFPLVCLIENKENTGFAKANNVGIGMAKGRYILLLNSDTRIIGDALEKLVFFLDRYSDVGVAAARLVYPDLSDQGAAKAFPTPVNMLFGRKSFLTRLFPNNRHTKKYIMSRTHRSNEPFEVDWVSGACLMVRKKVLDDVDYLDERYFMYWEDADLCYRIKQNGWKVYCVPEARVIHYEGKSTRRKRSNRLIIEFNKSAYRFYRKHYVRSSFQIMNLVAVLGLSLRTLVLLGMNMIRDKDYRDDSKNTVTGSLDI